MSKTWLPESAIVMYDRGLIAEMKQTSFFWRMSYRYRSNWRVLRIDGFEGLIFGPLLWPSTSTRPRIIFNYSSDVTTKQEAE